MHTVYKHKIWFLINVDVCISKFEKNVDQLITYWTYKTEQTLPTADQIYEGKAFIIIMVATSRK